MDNIPVPNSPNSTASQIQNIIPDDLVKIINPPEGNLTGANYVSLIQGMVRPPSDQDVPEDILNQMAVDFQSMVNSELAAQLLEFNPDVLMHNSPKSVLGVTQHFSVDSLLGNPNNPPPITLEVNAFVEDNVISDAQPSSLSYLIDGAWAGATESRFVDADDYDNLIEIRPEDAQQPGGIRAWGGNDKVMGTPNSDTANGNEGNDRIFGYGGNDLLMGGAGDDYLAGGAGMDVLVGEAGIDELIGNAGDDILMAQGDGDFLTGSTGADQFILCADTLMNDAAYAHRILDFNPNQGDTIKIANFKGIPGRNQISFASVDVNQDDQADTAIFCSDGVVGVIMSKDLSQMNLTSSIFMVGPQDLTLTKISQFSMLSSQ
jgi:hypothetical protein